ncbi:hypothetical protein QQ045_001455 [Rhodiola kirilowii]
MAIGNTSAPDGGKGKEQLGTGASEKKKVSGNASVPEEGKGKEPAGAGAAEKSKAFWATRSAITRNRERGVTLFHISQVQGADRVMISAEERNVATSKFDHYEDAIQSSWNNGNKCRNLFMFQSKLKNMKIMLKQRFVGRTRGMDKRVNVAREALFEAQCKSENNPNDLGCCEEERRLALEFKKLKYNQFLFNRQRTNAQWIKEGDANNKFFLSLLKGRRSRNNIT